MKTIFCYLMTDGFYFKIGKSVNPKQRLKGLKTANVDIQLIDYSNTISEATLHHLFKSKRVHGEWFDLYEHEVEAILLIFGNNKKYNPDYFTKHRFDIQKTYHKYIINFGKYKGQLIKSINDIEYFKWLKLNLLKELSPYEQAKNTLLLMINNHIKENEKQLKSQKEWT
jgi:hypothetical protein